MKKVSQLTEKEAKDELCLAMDLITRLMSISEDAANRTIQAAKNAGY